MSSDDEPDRDVTVGDDGNRRLSEEVDRGGYPGQAVDGSALRDDGTASEAAGRTEGPFTDDVVQYLSPEGSPLPDVDLPDVDDETLLEVYELLVLARRFDERALSLQRQGRIATWAPMSGQEGSQVASTVAMDDTDWLYPTYRDNAAKIAHGTEAAAILARLAGHEHPEGFDAGERVFPESIPIASHLPHAVGAGMASRYRGTDEAHVAHFGDGATSEGDFHEALNFAGVFDAPVVFVCHNNGWAISVPTDGQTASYTLAQKAHAYGFDGVRVDGMDPLAVYDVTDQALDRVREGIADGPRPMLIEALEYRLGAHTTADDPDVYRDGVPDVWAERDPVPRFETFLRETGRIDDETVDAVATHVDERLADAIDRVESLQADPEDLFEYVYAESTPRLDAQRASLRADRDGQGD